MPTPNTVQLDVVHHVDLSRVDNTLDVYLIWWPDWCETNDQEKIMGNIRIIMIS